MEKEFNLTNLLENVSEKSEISKSQFHEKSNQNPVRKQSIFTQNVKLCYSQNFFFFKLR